MIERLPNGKGFEIGPVRAHAPGERLVVGWRHACLGPGHATKVQVTFEPVGSKTRVRVERRGWHSAPQAHVARHGIPLQLTNPRQGEPWRAGLERLSQRAAETVPPRLPD